MKLTAMILPLIFAASCNGQAPKDSLHTRQAKVIKNHFITQYPDEFFFIQCGLQDQKGNMWFGSAGDGIYQYDGSSFANFTKRDGLNHNDILCCLEDRAGNIWFGTRNGLILYKPSTTGPGKKDFSSFLIASNVVDASSGKKIPYAYRIADNFVWSIFQDKSGKMWFGTNNGIYIYNPAAYPESGTTVFTRFLDNDSISNTENLHLKDVTSILEDKEGNIWFCSGYIHGEGICRYDGRSITHFKPDGISSFRSIIAGRNGHLFFLNTFHGVYAYDGKTFSNFTKQIGLTNDTIIAIKEDQAGNFWFGTNSYDMKNGGSGGLWRYDGKSLKLFTTKDGLSHNCVFCIVEDKGGNIWFGTRNTGLCRYDGKSFTDFSE